MCRIYHYLTSSLEAPLPSKGPVSERRERRNEKTTSPKTTKRNLKKDHFEKERTPSSKHPVFRFQPVFQSVYFRFFFQFYLGQKIPSHGGQWNFSSLKICKNPCRRTCNSLKLTNIASPNRPKLQPDHLTQASKFSGVSISLFVSGRPSGCTDVG